MSLQNYQSVGDDEEVELLVVEQKQEEVAPIPPSSNVFKYTLAVAVVCAIAATSALAVSASSGMRSAAPRSNKILTLKAAKEASSVITYSTLSDDEKESLFEDFKVTFDKEYEDDDDEDAHYATFLTTLGRIDEFNAAETSTAIYGVNKFADIDEETLARVMLLTPMTQEDVDAIHGTASDDGDDKADDDRAPKTAVKTTDRKLASKKDTLDTTGVYVNWAGIRTTAIKDQGYCNSCWDFVAIESVESSAIQLAQLTTSQPLSTQQPLACMTGRSCSWAGTSNTIAAWKYITTAGGVQLESTYPYTAYYYYYTNVGNGQPTCLATSTKYVVTVASYKTQCSLSETCIQSYVSATGPLANLIYVSSAWYSYQSGIMSATTCGYTTTLNHYTQIVGYSSTGTTPYYIVRNSWGSTWGALGYIYIEANTNACGISKYGGYVTTTKK